jgi:putative ABC transport system permease protein
LGVGPVGVAGIRDALGRPARSLLTALALALAIVAVLTTMSTQRTIDRMFGDPALSGDPEEVRIYPTDADGASGAAAAAVTKAVGSEPAVGSWFTETPQDLALGDETFLGIAMAGDIGHAGYVVPEGRMFSRHGEAVAGWGWLDRFGLAVGDHVQVRADGEPLDLTIVGRYREGEDTGEVLRFSLADLQSVVPDRGPEWVSVNLRPGADAARVTASFQQQLRGEARVEQQTVEGSDELDAFRFAFLLVSALVIVVALANLASTMVLAVRERTHDFGVLRAVGVTPRQVVTMVAIGGGALAVVATVIAIPLGLWVSVAVADVAGMASGIGPGIGAGPGLLGVLVVVPVAIAVAASLGALASRRATHAQVSELVRYE